MMKSIPSSFAILIFFVVLYTQVDDSIGYAESSDRGLGPSWLTDSHRNRVELFKKWLGNKPMLVSSDADNLLHHPMTMLYIRPINSKVRVVDRLCSLGDDLRFSRQNINGYKKN